jgi:fructose-specific phosphotransferase system IIA component
MTQIQEKEKSKQKTMELFSKNLIKVNYAAIDKISLISEMVDFLYQNDIISDRKIFLDAIMERENIMSTGIGKMVGIPHAYSETVKKLAIALYILDNEIDFDSIDGLPVKAVFMIAVPIDMKKEYMNILAMISNFLTDEKNHANLISAKSVDQVYNILKDLKL